MNKPFVVRRNLVRLFSIVISLLIIFEVGFLFFLPGGTVIGHIVLVVVLGGFSLNTVTRSLVLTDSHLIYKNFADVKKIRLDSVKEIAVNKSIIFGDGGDGFESGILRLIGKNGENLFEFKITDEVFIKDDIKELVRKLKHRIKAKH